MAAGDEKKTGPDLTLGVSVGDIGESGLLRGHVEGKPVVLARIGDEFFAVGAKCTHYQGPLEKGLIVGETLRCPWHHACFSLRNGEAIGAPAIDPLPCWEVKREGDRITVRERISTTPARAASISGTAERPDRIVIIGGGAAGFACAEMLRRRGWSGSLTMLSDDADLPCDRPNLSKDYLAGKIPEKWLPLKPRSFYERHEIDLHLGTSVTGIDADAREVTTGNGQSFPFDRLLIATGAEPSRPPIEGADQDHVFTLRTQADSDALRNRAEAASRAVVLGSGFIGLEVAASLRARGLEVHVVSRDELPLEKVLGPEFGQLIRRMHEEKGVTFHLNASIAGIGPSTVTLEDGSEIGADLVILGTGVKPRVSLAESAGIEGAEHGIPVNDRLETAIPGIYAAGDVASWPDARTGEMQRIEHWVLAERHGQLVAENMLGADRPFRDVPFFWSAHYGTSIRYVGHAQSWDSIEIDGDMPARNGAARFIKDGRTLAIATIGRDLQALRCEAEMEQAEG